MTPLVSIVIVIKRMIDNKKEYIVAWDLGKGDGDHLIEVTVCQYYSN